MELQDACHYAKNPSKIIDPQMCNYATSLISGWIMDLEEQVFEQEITFLEKEEEIFKQCNEINATAKRRVKLTPEWRALQTTKLELRKYRLLRGVLRDRFQVLAMIKKF